MLDQEGGKNPTWKRFGTFILAHLTFYHQSKGAVWRGVLWNLLYTNSRNGSSLFTDTDTHTHSFFIQLRWLLSYRWIIVWTYKKKKKERKIFVPFLKPVCRLVWYLPLSLSFCRLFWHPSTMLSHWGISGGFFFLHPPHFKRFPARSWRAVVNVKRFDAW